MHNNGKDHKILICPLNWGLGHATRCIPIIDALLEKDIPKNSVHIASSGRSLQLLQQEYNDLHFSEIVDYDISYQEKGSLAVAMAKQLPKLWKKIQQETKEIDAIVKEHGITHIISDNRFGAYHKSCKSIFMTHQLDIQTPKNLNWLKFFIRKANHHFIKKYNECWIPDFENHQLSGVLSKPFFKHPRIVFTGPLSRFKPDKTEKDIDILCLISGPEPQRTSFEYLLKDQCKDLGDKNIFYVLGKPELNSKEKNTFGHLNAQELNKLISRSKLVISRAGYSTIMDLVSLNQPALLIPTPGQTEQEYLAEHLKSNKLFTSYSQKDINVKEALNKASFKTSSVNQNNDHQLSILINDLLDR